MTTPPLHNNKITFALAVREFGWMIYWSNQHYAGQSLVLSLRERERVRVCVFVLWRLGGVAWSLEKGRNSLGWGPKREARYELCSGAITKILPLIRLALNNTLTDMTNRCIRACHSSLFGFLSSFHSCYSFVPGHYRAHIPSVCPNSTNLCAATDIQTDV